MANAKAVLMFWEEFVKRHKATAPAKYRDDLINAGMTYNKGGYHSTRAWLQKNKPGDYSIQRPADRTGPSDVGAALDITFKSAQRGDYTMITAYMKRLKAAIKDRRVYASDGVTNTFREVIGTLDGKNPANVSFYKEQVLSNSDRSHMWHLHFSFSRKWLNDPKVYLPLLDILFPTYSGGAGGGTPSGSGKEDEEVKAEDIKKIAETTVNKLLAQQIEFTEGEQNRYGPSGYPKSLSVRSLLVHGGGEPRELARMEGLRYTALLNNVQQNDAYIRNVSKQVQSVAEQVSQLAQAVEALSKKLGC